MTAKPPPVFSREGERLIPSARAAGPWDAGLMHGGAPAAALTWAAETCAAPAPMRIARLTLDLMRPAPIAPAAVAVEIVREGRNIQLLSLVMEIAGKIVARASVLRVREGDTQPAAQAPALDAPPPEDCAQLTQFGASGFGENFDLRLARGPWRSGRPTAVWFRLKAQLIDGVETSPAMRAAAIADFGNGISSVLDFNAWTFINADLTLNFARAPEGDWMLLDAETWIGPDGGGFAASRLCDRAGAFARGHQNLVIARR